VKIGPVVSAENRLTDGNCAATRLQFDDRRPFISSYSTSISSHMYVDYKTDISFVVAQGTFQWQPLKFCSFCKRFLQPFLILQPLLFASAFDNGFTDRKSAFKRFNGNNHATSHPNLVNLHTIISKFTLLKRAIFAAIRPQFDDDLHSSRPRFETDWNIAILISAE